MRIKSLVELAQAIEDGKEIEFAGSLNTWNAIDIVGYSLRQLSDWVADGSIRIKPQLKIIDLSVLIESGIDCEFSHSPSFDFIETVGRLARVSDDATQFHTYNGNEYQFCVPRTNHIHHWKGGTCPLPEGFNVWVHYRDDTSCEVESADWEWHHDKDKARDIIGFEVLGVLNGWIYPWESEL